MFSGRIRIFFIPFYFLLLNCSGQQLNFEHLDISNGLPSTEVYGLLQDQKGYIWAFTEYGIVKHNGNEFIPICQNLDFMQSAVYASCKSSNETVYFANSKANIYEVRNDSAYLIKGIEKVSKEILSHSEVMLELFITPDSIIYFSTLDHSYMYSLRSNTATDLTSRYNTDSTFLYFKKQKKNYFLIKGMNSILKKSTIKILNEKDKTISIIPCEGFPSERSMFREKEGSYYLLGKHSLTLFSNNEVKQKRYFKENTITFEIAPNGHIWVGLGGAGVYELDEKLNVISNYFSDYTVSDILFDDQSGVWISTIENGVYYCKHIHNINYNNIPELNGSISLLKKVNNKLFIGSVNGNLFVKEKDILRKINVTDKYSPTDITYTSPFYFLSTKGKNYLLDEDLITVRPYNKSQGSYGVAPLNKDSVLFVTGSTIYKQQLDDQQHQMEVQPISRIRNLIRRNEHEYLIGTKNGLYLFTNKVSIPEFLTELKDKSISRLKTAPSGGVWICTKGNGFYLLTAENKLIKYKDIPSQIINDVCVKDDSLLLLSTNKGLFFATLKSQKAKLPWLLLLNDEILCAEYQDNVLYLATKKGLMTIMEPNFKTPAQSKFYLESVFVNKRKQSACPAKLAYDQNNLLFNFNLLSYSLPEKQIAYELTGPISEKGILNTTQLHFQNLPPGTYSLVVSAKTSITGKNARSIYCSFFIEPAFWQTDLFLIATILFILSLLLLITIYNYNRFKKKQERKSMTIRLLVESRLTALKAQINPHFISNSLTAMQQLMLKDIDKANQYVARFSMLIRDVLKYSDKFVTSLESEIKIIELNIELEQLRFNNSFSFEKRIAPELRPNELFIPPLITQPFIENAIWHGLLPLKDRPAKLILDIYIQENNLFISIIDNGTGRQQKKEPEENDRESKGTALIRDKMKNLNLMYSTEGILMRYTDLKDEAGKGCGTQVDLIFPLEILNKLYYEKD